MQKLFIGLLVKAFIIMFFSPLMAADPPEGINLSNQIALNDSLLHQIRGQGWGVLPLVVNLQLRLSSRETGEAGLAGLLAEMSTFKSVKRKVREQVTYLEKPAGNFQGFLITIDKRFNFISNLSSAMRKVSILQTTQSQNNK